MNLNDPDFRARWEPLSQPIDPDPEVLRVLHTRIMQRISADPKPEMQPAHSWARYDAKFLKELGISPLE